MPTIPPVELKGMFDGTDLRTGTQEAERDIQALADTVDTEADNMRRSLQSIDDGVSSTFGPTGTFNSSIDGVVDTGGQRMGEAGAEIASEFGSNLAEGISSGDTSATVVDSIAGLGATVASAGGPLAFLGVGALLGGALVRGLIVSTEEKSAEFIASMASIFDSIEVKARTSMRQVRKEILDTFTFESVLTELGGDQGLQGGIEKVQAAVDATGIGFNTIVDILRGQLNPENREAYKILQNYSDLLDTQLTPGQYTLTQEMRNQKEVSSEIVGFAEEVIEKQRTVLDQKRLEQGYLKSNRDDYAYFATTADRQADSAERTAAAYERTERALLNINRNAGRGNTVQ